MGSTEHFWKGQGTGNDFIIIEDLDDLNPPQSDQIKGWCDRRFGVGGDGLLRVVRDDSHEAAPYFMDYRNADGSLAEMCGNGLRVFARHLVARGLVDGPEFDVRTRAGIRSVRVDDQVSVSMGAVNVDQLPTWIEIDGDRRQAIGVDVGNPHAVAFLDSVEQVRGLDLTTQPGFDAQRFPHGVNVEFCAEQSIGRIMLRVHERGVGETLSCGTGVVAAAAVHATRHDGLDEVLVHVTGGELTVDLRGEQAWLTGSAVIVAQGEMISSV